MLLTVEETAALLKCSDQSIRNMVRSKRLKPTVVLSERCLRFDPTDVLRQLARPGATIPATAEPPAA